MSASSDELKFAISWWKTQFLTFSENFNFGWFWLVFLTLGSILGAQTRSNWLCHGTRDRQAHPKEFFGLWAGGDWGTQAGDTGQNMRFSKISTFKAQISPAQCASNWIPRNHVVYPPRSTPGTWNFWASYAEKKDRAAEAEIGRRPYLTRASR